MLRSLALTVSLIMSTTTLYAAPKVVTSIRPLHSIVTSVMGDVGNPKLLLATNPSPHAATLKPSQATALQEADIVFWIGPELETFMIEPLETLSDGKHVPLLAKTKGLNTYDRRGKDDHGDHKEHADHKDEHDHDKEHKDEHAHDDHDDHKDEKKHDDHDDHADHKDKKKHADHDDGHNHVGTLDAHIWVDPDNAGHIAETVASSLAKIDAENAAKYKANAAAFVERAEKAEAKIDALLKQNKASYFIQHDGFQYFEKRFGLAAPIVLTINPEVRPGAATVKELREKATKTKSACFLIEPQFNTALADTIFEGMDVKRVKLDIMGQKFATGPDQYFQTVDAIAASFADCLGS